MPQSHFDKYEKIANKPLESQEVAHWKGTSFSREKKRKRDAETILANINGYGGQVRFWRSNGQLDHGYLYPEHEENPEEAFRFAIAYEDGVNQHKAFEEATGTKEIKQEPIININRNPCTRCGLEFTQNYLMACKAKNEKCRNCAMTGHFARLCKTPKSGNVRGRGRIPARGGLRRINLIEKDDSKQ